MAQVAEANGAVFGGKMKVPFIRPSSSKKDVIEEMPCPRTQIISAIQQQIPPERIAARIGEMIQAQQPSESGGLETDWRTVEAGIRLYLDYATKFSAAVAIEDLPPRRLEPKTTLSEGTEARRETQRIYTNPQLETNPPRSTARVLPTKNQDPDALEPLENMRKLLIVETPLAVLQATTQENPSRNISPISAKVSTDLPFDIRTAQTPLHTAESPGRNLPLAALVACLVIGGIFASASQFHTRPQSSSISLIQEKPQTAETTPPQKTETATGLAALKPRFETSMW
jgi:hypothetical protein